MCILRKSVHMSPKKEVGTPKRLTRRDQDVHAQVPRKFNTPTGVRARESARSAGLTGVAGSE
jgi:hypothetical protein